MKKNYQTSNGFFQLESAAKSGKSLLVKTVAVLLLAGNSTFAQQKRNSQSLWDTKNLKNEVVNKRSRTAKHFINEDASKISAFISPSSIHYMESGKWEDINTNILGNNSNTHPYASVRNSVKTFFPADPFNQYVLMQAKEGTFKEKVKAIKFLNSNNAVVGTLPVSSNVIATVNGNRISYSGFYPNVSLDYSLGNDQRKFNLVIHSASFLNSIPAGATSIAIEEEFVSEAANTEIKMHKAELSVMVKNEQILSFSQPVAFDSNTKEEDLLSGEITVNKSGNVFSLNTSFSLSWLKSSSRIFPLHLDPTVNYYPLNVSMWTGQQGTSAGKTTGYLRLTTATTASWAKFDLGTLPAGAAVTGATFYGYHYTTTGSKIAEIRGLQAVDPVPAVAATLFNQTYSGPLYNGNYDFGTNTFGWNAGILNNAALTDIANAAGTWIGLGFGYLSGSTTFMYVYGHNAASSADIPYLEVTYFTTPCVGAPAPNAVTPASFTTCPSYTNPAIGMASSYTVGGLTYQWYSSTVSPVGLYVAIPGATNNIAPTPTLGTTTWFQVVATCTNPGGLSTTLTPAQFTVAGTTVDNIPYFEGFEGIQGDHRLPNCSWSTSNLGSTIGTYTSSRSDNRVPYDGNKFASFGTPSNNHYVYTNGLNLIAGITYSASVMYATEYTGGNNWSELSLLVGANQATTGLVNIATASPAISGAYKELTGLFTVPSTGVYYVAIKANGTAGTALYLSWDNLQVTIPCTGPGAVNSPTITMNAPTQTVCAGETLNLSASGADTYTWNTGANSSGITENPILPGLTNYIVWGTNALTGCTAQFNQPIQVNPSPVVLASAFPATVCVGATAVLSAYGNASSYLWSNGTSASVINVTTSAAASYTVIGTGTNGCTSSASQVLAIFNPSVINASSSIGGEACAGDEIILTANGASTYQWISDTSPNVLQGNMVNVTLPGTTVFTVTGTNVNGCESKYMLTQNVGACVGIKENKGNIAGLMVYPNPAIAALTVELAGASEKTIELLDVTGRVIFSDKNSNEKTEVNVSNLANGIYYVKVKTSSAIEVIKVVKN